MKFLKLSILIFVIGIFINCEGKYDGKVVKFSTFFNSGKRGTSSANCLVIEYKPLEHIIYKPILDGILEDETTVRLKKLSIRITVLADSWEKYLKKRGIKK